LPRGEPPAYRKVETPKLDRVVRRTMLDKVQLPKVAYAYNSPPAYKEGDAEMNLLAEILAEGKDSRLYQRLVMRDQSAVSVSANQNGAALGSIFRIDVVTKPDADLTRVERAVDEELSRIVREGPTPDEVRRRAATTELGILSSLQSVMARADRLNEYEYYFGNPDSLQRDLDRYRAATAGTVRQWAARVLTPEGRAIIRVLPEQRERIVSPRDQRPAELAASPFTPPQPVILALSNGLPLYVFPRHDLPVVGCTILINPPGTVDDAAHAGLGSLAAAMTQEGAGERDSVAFAQAAAALGATLSAGSDYESLSVSMQVLARNFDSAAALLGDATLRPRMQASDFDRAKSVRLDELRQQDEEPQAVAARVAERMLMGDASRYGLPAEGTVATVSPITLVDVKSSYERLLREGSAKVLVAGDIDPRQARATLEKVLSGWPGKGSETPANEPQPFRTAGGMRVFIVDRPGAVQTAIHLAAPGVQFADPHRVDADLANVVLGGSFTSRLNRNLREVHGYTYGARSSLAAGRTLGTFHAASAVKADVTGPALGEFLKELKRLAGGDITAEETTKARETFRNETIESFGTLGGMLRESARLLTNAAPLDTPSRDLTVAAGAKPTEVNNAAKALDLNRAVLVLVGDRKLILDQIKTLNLPAATGVDAQGAPDSKKSE
jgi:predicted Zn-dependent peptidase